MPVYPILCEPGRNAQPEQLTLPLPSLDTNIADNSYLTTYKHTKLHCLYKILILMKESNDPGHQSVSHSSKRQDIQ